MNNYDKAKTLLLKNKDLVGAKYYNSYKGYTALKVGWWISYFNTKTTPAQQRTRIRKLHKQLVRLSNYHNNSTNGSGYIYGFKREVSK